MEGLVNYSSEDEQDDYPYSKVAVRERGSGGRGAADSNAGQLKRRHERSRSNSHDRDASPYRRSRDAGGERFKTNYNDEDKYKTDKRTEKFSRDHREKRDNKDARSNRDTNRDYDNGHKHDYKKYDDHKRSRDPKRDFKRDSDYYKDDKRFNRYDDRKPPSTYNKERFNSSKPRYDRKQYDERINDDRRLNDDRRSSGSGPNFDDKRKDFSDKRNYDDSKSDRRSNDDRRTSSKRSYNEDRTSSYRSRRSVSPSPAASSRNSTNKYDKDDYYSKRDRKYYSRSRSPASRSNSVEKIIESEKTSHNSSQRGSLGIGGVGEHVIETRPETETQAAVETKIKPTARNFEALLSLPLSETAVKHCNVPILPINTATASTATTAAVQLPSYYNPNVINPNKYVEQMQKRKLIWGAKKVEDSASKWGHAQFSQDQDGKVASKFMRLMGIKSGGGVESSTSPNESEKKSPASSATSPSNSTDVKSREAMFTTMEHQYEVARQVTHTMRGVGLGFGSQARPY